MEQQKPKQPPLKKPNLKEETLNKETLSILKKINTGVSKITLVNKNVLKINDGVKTLNAKIVNTNLGVKSMNMKLAKIDVNMAKLLNTMNKQKGKNGKGVSYLDEQLQNETLAQTKKTNVTLDKILVAVSKGGTVIKKDGNGLFGGLATIGGLVGLGGAVKMLGGLGGTVKMLGKLVRGAAIGSRGGALGAAAGAAIAGGGMLFGDELKNNSVVKWTSSTADKVTQSDAFKSATKWLFSGVEKLTEGIGTAIEDSLPQIDIAQEEWWKDTFGGVGETLSDMFTNYTKDMKNMFGESASKTLKGVLNTDWFNLETWEKLYGDPDNFFNKLGEAGMKLNAATGSLGIPMVNFGKGTPTQKTNRNAYMAFAEEEAIKQGLDPNLIKAIIQQESSWKADAVSPLGAGGLMQLMPKTAKELGVEDVFDPYQNIKGGVKYFKQLLKQYDGNVDKALAAYNWGMGNLAKKGMSKMPAETIQYLSKVKGYKESFENEPMIFSGKPTTFSTDIEKNISNSYNDLIKNKKAKEVEAIDNFMGNVLPKPSQDNMGLLSTDKMGYGRGLIPSQEAPMTNQLQSSAIEKDKLSMSKPESQQPTMFNQIVNNGNGNSEGYNVDSQSPFDIYNKGLFNPYYNRV